MKFLERHFKWGRWLIGGILLGLAFVFSWSWFLVFPGLLLLLHSLLKAKDGREVLWGSFVMGIFLHAGALSWIWYTYPLVWLGLSPGFIQLLLIAVYWLMVALVQGIALIPILFTQWWLFKRYGLIALILFPFMWIMGEILASFTFSLYMLGIGSSLNIYFSFGYVGYLVSHLPVLYPVTMVLGVYGLSFTVATSSLLGYLWWSESDRIKAPLLLTTLGGMAMIGGLFVFNDRSVPTLATKVIAIDTSFTSSFLQTDNAYSIKAAALEDSIQTALKYQPDIVLLPEDSRWSRSYQSTAEALNAFKIIAPESKALVVDSSRIKTLKGDTVLRAFYYDLGQGAVYVTDKQYLVPQGEYLPYLMSWLLNRVGNEAVIDKLKDRLSYQPGPMTDYSHFPADVPGTLFCFESVSTLGVQKLSTNRSSQLILHPTSHAWFHEPEMFWHHLNSMLRVQALWSNKIIVQAGNEVPGAAYYPNGKIQRGTVVDFGEYWRLVEYNF